MTSRNFWGSSGDELQQIDMSGRVLKEAFVLFIVTDDDTRIFLSSSVDEYCVIRE